MNSLTSDLLKNIPSYKNWEKIEKIDKGWSADEKYFVRDLNGKEFLLRLSDSGKYHNKKSEFEIMKKVFTLGINMSEPLEFDTCGNGEKVYSLLSWVKGDDLVDVLSGYPEEKQYEFGLRAGRILKTFHSVKAPEGVEDWESRMSGKIERLHKGYQESGLKIDNDECIIKYARANVDLLKNREQCFQHGDFHVGNIILTKNEDISIIDFNRWDYGDPYEEFYKMMFFSREASIPFTLGQLDGYFDKKIPDDFFPLLALYMASVLLFTIVWSIPFGEEEVKGALRRAEMVLRDYDNFNNPVPAWFSAK